MRVAGVGPSPKTCVARTSVIAARGRSHFEAPAELEGGPQVLVGQGGAGGMASTMTACVLGRHGATVSRNMSREAPPISLSLSRITSASLASSIPAASARTCPS